MPLVVYKLPLVQKALWSDRTNELMWKLCGSPLVQKRKYFTYTNTNTTTNETGFIYRQDGTLIMPAHHQLGWFRKLEFYPDMFWYMRKIAAELTRTGDGNQPRTAWVQAVSGRYFLAGANLLAKVSKNETFISQKFVSTEFP